MVEGPTAHLYSIRISRETEGEIINNILYRGKKAYIDPNLLIGRKIDGSETYGKNILIHIDGYSIRIHLMLYGSIHIYDINEPLLKPFERVRLLIEGKKKKIVVYNAPIVEIRKKSDVISYLKSILGPDPLRDDWNREEAIRRLLSNPDKKIGVVILDQSIISGIGNILRNEILFRARVHPERCIRNLSREEIERIVDIASDLSREFLNMKAEKGKIKPLLYVYNRYNKRCKVCGNPIKFYIQKEIGRKTFVCEYCQK